MRHAHLLLTISTLSCLSACAGSDGKNQSSLVEVESEQTIAISWEEYRKTARAASPGSQYYIVESDLFFADDSALRAHYEDLVTQEKSKLAVFRRISTGFEPIFEGVKALDIVYCTSNSFANKAVAVADIASATRDWEQVVNVRFRYDSTQDASCDENNSNVDFAFEPLSIADFYGCGTSKMNWLPPHDGCPQGGWNELVAVKGVLQANYGAYPFPGSFANITMVGNLRHELGHMLGFRHEHPWAPGGGGCAETPDIASLDLTGRRLTDYDQLSVMHYPYCAGITTTDQTISSMDGVGARSIYGIPASWYQTFL